MTIVDTIEMDLLTARKNKDTNKKDILSTLLGEVKMVGKNARNGETTDDEAAKVVQKFLKGAEEMLTYAEDETAHSEVMSEICVYQKYLPKQMTEEELRKILLSWKETNYPDTSNIGGYMQALKRCYDGQYNGKMASAILKEIL